MEHFERRLETMDGKGMIVCMSRRICVDLYDRIVKLRPQWHDTDDAKGAIKIVMTGSAKDGPEWQQHIRTKAKREALAKRLKDPKDPLKLVIVRDMWLTGFDAPCLHTMYCDKPMKGHGLMQAIARVNRVFKDKPGGLVVDYLGLAEMLKQALGEYTEGDRDETGVPIEEVVEKLRETAEVVRAMLHGFDYKKFFTGKPEERLGVLAGAKEFILEQDRKAPKKPDSKEPDAKTRYMNAVAKLTTLFALCVPHEDALELRDEIAFFQGVRAGFVKLSTGGSGATGGDTDSAIRQLISKAVASEQVIDIFAAAGLKKPDISILSDEFLAEIQGMPHRNLALELLQKLLTDEIKGRAKKNLIQSRSFAAMLEQAIRAYQNRSLESAQVIAQLIALAKEMREAHKRGESLGLSDDEIAFYDALEVNDSAVQVLGRRQAAADRPRTGRDGAEEHDHRLDAEGEREGQPAAAGAANPEQVRLPAGHAAEGRPDRARTGRGAGEGLGRMTAVSLPVLTPTPARPQRVTPTDVSQFVRLEQCERFLRLRLSERAGLPFMEQFGVTPQRITPLLSLSGKTFEEGVEADLGGRFRSVHYAEKHAGDHNRPADTADLLAEVARLKAGETVVLFQPRLEATLGAWQVRGDVDLIRLERAGGRAAARPGRGHEIDRRGQGRAPAPGRLLPRHARPHPRGRRGDGHGDPDGRPVPHARRPDDGGGGRGHPAAPRSRRTVVRLQGRAPGGGGRPRRLPAVGGRPRDRAGLDRPAGRPGRVRGRAVLPVVQVRRLPVQRILPEGRRRAGRPVATCRT